MLRHILVVLFLCCAVHAETFSATGDSAAELQDDIDAFTSQLGVNNGFTPTTNAGGFRSINWDAAPDSVSDPAAVRDAPAFRDDVRALVVHLACVRAGLL